MPWAEKDVVPVLKVDSDLTKPPKTAPVEKGVVHVLKVDSDLAKPPKTAPVNLLRE